MDAEKFMRSKGIRQTNLQLSAHERILKSMQKWVELHPAPDKPVLSIGGSSNFSPRQLLNEVASRSTTGLLIEEMVETARSQGPLDLDDILGWFEGHAPRGADEAPYPVSTHGPRSLYENFTEHK
jgi:hypothetical protein